MDHRGGNQQPGKHSQKQTAESKKGGRLFLRLRNAGQGPAALPSSNQISEHGKLEQNAEQEDRQSAEAQPPVYQKEVGKKLQTQRDSYRKSKGNKEQLLKLEQQYERLLQETAEAEKLTRNLELQ